MEAHTHTLHIPWIIARARIPPVLVPAIQSKSSLIGWPASLSRAINIWINTRPLIPPPSRHRSLSILQKRVQKNSDQTVKFLNLLILTFHLLLILHFGAIHFRLASVHCADCSSHVHDVLKACLPITETNGREGMGATHIIKFMNKRWKSKSY